MPNWCEHEQVIEQTIELSVKWDAMTVMCPHCKVNAAFQKTVGLILQQPAT